MVEDNVLTKRVACTSAADFLDALSPRGPYFRGKEGAGSTREHIDVVVFRGHSDSSYQLIPSALRSPSPVARFDWSVPKTEAEQIRVEVGLLRRFFSLADSVGLPLPEDS